MGAHTRKAYPPSRGTRGRESLVGGGLCRVGMILCECMGLLSVPAVLQRKQAGTLHIGLGDTLMPRAASLYKKCPAYRLQYKPYRASCLDVILFRQVVKVVSFSGTASLDSPYKTGVKACPEIEKHGYFLPKTAPQVVCGIAVEPHSLQWSRAITRHNPCTAVERFLKERS